MAWSKQQNPTGYASVGLRDIQLDPLSLTTTAQDARAILRGLANRSVPSTYHDAPVAANAQKGADGFAPVATGPTI